MDMTLQHMGLMQMAVWWLERQMTVKHSIKDELFVGHQPRG